MARISTYPIDSSVNVNDYVIGTDSEDSNITKNYTIASIVALAPGTTYINASDNAGISVTTIPDLVTFVPLDCALTLNAASSWSVGGAPNEHRIVYDGNTKFAIITVTINVTGTAGDDVHFCLTKNGVKISGTSQKTEIPADTPDVATTLTLQSLQSVSKSDYFSVSVKNTTGTNSVTATHYNIVAHTL